MESGWGEQGAWAVAWKQKKTSIYVELVNPLSVAHAVKQLELPDAPMCVFGLSDTAESAMEKVADRLKGDPFFRRRFTGGAFVPIPYHLSIVNDGKLMILPGEVAVQT